MRKARIWSWILPLLALALLSSCQNELLPLPSGTKVQTSRSVAPGNLMASQGRNKIHLSWSEVSGAQRYCVYASDSLTPTESSFSLVRYVQEPECEIEAKPGSEAWYRVSAVLSTGQETVCGASVRGTTLATPVITALEPGTDGSTAVTVYWYMSNCRSDTYGKDVSYTVTATDGAKNTFSTELKGSLSEDTSLTVQGLAAHTAYTFTVTARTPLGDESESASVTKETLHRLQPESPQLLEATCGTRPEGVMLTFMLPEAADLQRKEDKTYESTPLTFTIKRRIQGGEDWEPMESAKLVFEDDGTELTGSNYPMEGGKVVCWTDGTCTKGVPYEYRVQSYADLGFFMSQNGIGESELKKSWSYIETAGSVSSATTSGWRMGEAALTATPTPADDPYEYETDDEGTPVSSKIIGEHLLFAAEWDNFKHGDEALDGALEGSFTYILCERHVKFNGEEVPESEVERFPSLGALNGYVKDFNLAGGDEGERGEYTFTLYIVPKDAGTGKEGAVLQASTPVVTLTDNAGEIEGFKVEGGRTNRFRVSWRNNPALTYTLSYTESRGGTEGSSVEVFSGKAFMGETVVCDDPIQNPPPGGVVRTYRLIAKSTAAGEAPISRTEKGRSLGIPEPGFSMKKLDYTSATVTWDEVQSAERYEVLLEGKLLLSFTAGEEPSAESHLSVTEGGGTTAYSYTFGPEELGEAYWKNAEASGTPVSATIRAVSEVSASEQTAAVRTIGPATLSLTASAAASEDSISLSWESVPGARGYQLLRRRLDGTESDWETFFVDAEGLYASADGSRASAMDVSASDGRILLSDRYAAKPASGASQSDVTQSRIPWGIGIQYQVVPVLDEHDEYDGTTLKPRGGGIQVSYANAGSLVRTGCTTGYGMDVTATKAESSGTVTVSWEAPWWAQEGLSGEETRGLRPTLLRRPSGSTGAFILFEQLTPSATRLEISAQNLSESERLGAYEYAVHYSYTKDASFVPEYTEYLAASKEQNGEPKNKGYLFYLPPLYASNEKAQDGSEGFSENLNWTEWDYSARKNGPEDGDGIPAYTIWAKNKNNSPGWFKIAEVSKDGTVRVQEDPGWYATDIRKYKGSLRLTPKDVTDSSGTAGGLLRVQRDYKHYYMIQARRTNSEGETVYAYRGLDESVWTYRRISAEELAKSVTLILSDAINQSGISSGGARHADGSVGRFYIEHHSASKSLSYGTDGGNPYQHVFGDVPGARETELTSGFTIKVPVQKARRAADGSKAYYFTPAEISVSHESGLSSYEGTVSFTAGAQGHESWAQLSDGVITEWSLSVTASSGTAGTSLSAQKDEDGFKRIFPFSLGQDHGTSYKTFNGDLPTYKGDWWPAREGGTEDASFSGGAD